MSETQAASQTAAKPATEQTEIKPIDHVPPTLPPEGFWPQTRTLLEYMSRTEVHTYAFSVAANVILSLFPFILLDAYARAARLSFRCDGQCAGRSHQRAAPVKSKLCHEPDAPPRQPAQEHPGLLHRYAAGHVQRASFCRSKWRSIMSGGSKKTATTCTTRSSLSASQPPWEPSSWLQLPSPRCSAA